MVGDCAVMFGRPCFNLSGVWVAGGWYDLDGGHLAVEKSL